MTRGGGGKVWVRFQNGKAEFCESSLSYPVIQGGCGRRAGR